MQEFEIFSFKIIEILDLECALLSLLSKNFVSTKWRIYKAFWLVPDSCVKEFRAVAGRANWFFFKKVCKNNYIEIWSGKKTFFKGEKVSRNQFPWFFLRKTIVLNRTYIEIVVWKCIFNVVVQAKTKHEKSRQTQTQ
jgi:hypothetical protein